MAIKPLHAAWGALVIVALVGISYTAIASSAQPSEVKAAGALEITEPHYEFGTVGLDVVEHAYTIKNTGAGPLTITQLSTSCGCTTARIVIDGVASALFGMDHGNLRPTDVVLAPGQEATIVAAYNPLAHGPKNAAGHFRRVVYVQTKNPSDEHQLTFDVTVDPSLHE